MKKSDEVTRMLKHIESSIKNSAAHIESMNIKVMGEKQYVYNIKKIARMLNHHTAYNFACLQYITMGNTFDKWVDEQLELIEEKKLTVPEEAHILESLLQIQIFGMTNIDGL